MATTTRGIPYPDDYNDVADVPAALQSLATIVDGLIGAVDTKAIDAGDDAAAAAAQATTATAGIASHSHNGAGSVNIAMTAVTGLSAALGGKSDNAHAHTQYATATHTHDAQQIGAHTHSEYASTAHTHTQAQSHTSPDTDSSATSLHHTLGGGANQAAAGNHTHAGFAASTHTHDGFSASTHTHAGYSETGHTHSYAATSHTHNYAATSHNHSGDDLNIQTLTVQGSSVFMPGVYSNVTAGLDTVGMVDAAGKLRRNGSTQAIKYDITPLSGTLSVNVDPQRTCDVATVDPRAALQIAVTEFSIIDGGLPTERRLLGFIADDVADKLPVAVTMDAQTGSPVGVLDTAILASLLHIVRQQDELLIDARQRLEVVEQEYGQAIRLLEDRLSALESA